MHDDYVGLGIGRDILGQAVPTPAGNVSLRIGPRHADGTWSQSAHVTLRPTDWSTLRARIDATFDSLGGRDAHAGDWRGGNTPEPPSAEDIAEHKRQVREMTDDSPQDIARCCCACGTHVYVDRESATDAAVICPDCADAASALRELRGAVNRLAEPALRGILTGDGIDALRDLAEHLTDDGLGGLRLTECAEVRRVRCPVCGGEEISDTWREARPITSVGADGRPVLADASQEIPGTDTYRCDRCGHETGDFNAFVSISAGEPS